MVVPRNYSNFDLHINELYSDIYDQPSDTGHKAWATKAISWWQPTGKVLDVGCGTGFCGEIFKKHGVIYEGITLSAEDIKEARKSDIKVTLQDMTFLAYKDNTFDSIFARHVLEHSPFPIITLMEWRRVSKDKLLLIAPAPEHWGWGGRNHYSMATKNQLWWWLNRAGWEVINATEFTTKSMDYVKTFSGNPERIKEGRTDFIYPEGAPQCVEYWMLCEQSHMRKK